MTKRAWGHAARRRFLVTGTRDPYEAIDLALVTNGAPHPDNSNLFCQERTAESAGLMAFYVNADYRFGDAGLAADSPLLEPPKILWEPTRITYGDDQDINNNPIVNSGTFIFDPPPPATVPQPALIVRKAMPSYSVSIALTFMDTVNSDDFSIQGAGSVSAGQAYCDCIRPIEAYTRLAPYVIVEYRFLFRPGVDPFQHHPIDQSSMGWWKDPAGAYHTGNFYHAAAQGQMVADKVDGDVALDGTGKPISNQFFIGDAYGIAQTPVSPPAPPAGLKIEPTLSTANVKTMTWYGKQQQPFSGLI
ncbi:MAG TPA: hypothetical protein VFC78_02765 [Tepidisphaeraceae bacterium]|nr:hypothetical protein [Tepidisphaeraceae bacterium]